MIIMNKSSLEELSKKLLEVSERKRLYEKSEAVYQKLWSQLKDENLRCENLRRQLGKEQEDVTRLEKSNIVSLFHTILGNKEEKLERERQEQLAAQLSLEGCKKEIEALKKELTGIQSRL